MRAVWFVLYVSVVLLAWVLLSPGLEFFHIQVPLTSLTSSTLSLYGLDVPRTGIVNFLMIACQLLAIPMAFFAILGMDKRLSGENTDVRIYVWAGLISLIIGVWICAMLHMPGEPDDSMAFHQLRVLQQQTATECVLTLTFMVAIFLAVVKLPKSKKAVKLETT